VKKILKLQDHKHTAKRLEHIHTSYRGLFVVMAFFGLCLFFVAKTVGADSYVVSAGVAAPIPTVPAQITSPAANTNLTSQNVVISGTCPIISPAIVVVLYQGSNMMGSAGCTSSGDFSGTFSLNPGVNIITPKVMTITNDYGPDGSAYTLTYQQPVVPETKPPTTPVTVNPKSTEPAATPPAAELQIKADTPILAFKQNESFVWKIAINGGQSPYTIVVDWGDGTKSTYAANSEGQQSLEHIFKVNKNTLVRVSVKDATGKEVFTTVAGVTFRQQLSPVVNGISQTATSSTLSLARFWIIYGLTTLMIVAFWLGARTQHSKLVLASPKKKKITKRK
jgi:hypothetical protein